MTDKNSPPDVNENKALRADLFQEVKTWEGTQSGGIQLDKGATAVKSLMETKINFGNPTNKLTLLTEETFKEIGLELNSTIQEQMVNRCDFYYMTVTVDLKPKPGAKFWRLCCELDFSPKGKNEPIVQTIFPETKWKSVMKFGVGMNLGINENLDWSIGIDASKLAELANIPGHLKANIATKNELKAFVISDYTYQGGFAEITALGQGNSNCYWCIEQPDVLNMGTVTFVIVFTVPKGTKAIDLEGTAWAEVNIDWLFADIRDVFSELTDRFKNLIKNKNEAANKLAPVVAEKWTLNLP